MAKRKLLKEVTEKYDNKVRACRLRALIAKQEELSRITGIPRSTINAIENNRTFLSSPYALLIRDALGCKLDDLYSRRDGSDSGDSK